MFQCKLIIFFQKKIFFEKKKKKKKIKPEVCSQKAPAIPGRQVHIFDVWIQPPEF